MKIQISLFRLISASLIFSVIIGCEPANRSHTVKIIVEDNYTGLIRIIFGSKGIVVPVKNGEQSFYIPTDGVLYVKSKNPFSKYGTTEVESTSGMPVPKASHLIANDIPPDPYDRLFRVVGSPSNGQEMWAVIGTEVDQQNANLLLHEYQSEINRQK